MIKKMMKNKMMIKMVLVRQDIILGSIHRNYTTKIDRSMGPLIEEMDDTYRRLCTYENTPPMYEAPTPLDFQEMKQLVLSGCYHLSPFSIIYRTNVGATNFLRETELLLYGVVKVPYSKAGVEIVPYSNESELFMISSAASKDEIVLLALCRIFYAFAHENNPLYFSQLAALEQLYLDRLSRIARANKIYRLNLCHPILGDNISRSRILEIVNIYVDKDSIAYALVTQFIYNCYIDEMKNIDPLNYIPPLGPLTKLFKEVVIYEILEKAFRIKFEGVLFCRYLGEMVIYNTDFDEVTFTESAGYALLKELSLTGEIVSIEAGSEEPLMLFHNMYRMILDKNQRVIIGVPEEYLRDSEEDRLV